MSLLQVSIEFALSLGLVYMTKSIIPQLRNNITIAPDDCIEDDFISHSKFYAKLSVSF